MTVRLLPYTPARDAYRLLGVPPTASAEEIGVACRRLARTFHPDHNPSERATLEMQVVNAVRRAMTDPEWRATYDRERHRFHARITRPSPHPDAISTATPVVPLRLEDRSRRAVVRYARAAGAGVTAAARELLPRRCARCRMVLDATDAYCAGCGTRT